MKVTFTHKGWFGLCPVYFSGLETEAPHVLERNWLFKPLMILSEWIWAALFWLASAIDPNYEPEWPLHVTGTIFPPRVVEFEDRP